MTDLETHVPEGGYEFAKRVFAGTYLTFSLDDRRTVHVRSESRGIRVFGSSVAIAAAEVSLDLDFRPGVGDRVRVRFGQTTDEVTDRVPAAHRPDDGDQARQSAARELVRRAVEEAVEAEFEKVSRLWTDIAHIKAVGHMRLIAHYERLIAEPGVEWKDRRLYEDCIEREVRSADSIDEGIYSRPWLFGQRPGYVVLCEGFVMAREVDQWGQGPGEGWVPRCLFSNLSSARAFAGKQGRADMEVVRIRVADGHPYIRHQGGWYTPRWSLEDPVLTGALEPGL